MKNQTNSNGLKIRTSIKAGGIGMNHNERTNIKDPTRTTGLKIRSKAKSGRISVNHNQTMPLKVRSGIKAGGRGINHNETIVRESGRAEFRVFGRLFASGLFYFDILLKERILAIIQNCA